MTNSPYIFTFYSFKGGVGRSMALLNVAYALARRGRNILILDMDLEAPGVSGFLRRHQELNGLGHGDMLNLLEWASGVALNKQPAEAGVTGPENHWPPLTEYAVSIRSEKLQVEALQPRLGDQGRVDVVPVDDNRAYLERLERLDLHQMDRAQLLQLGTTLRRYLKGSRFKVQVPRYYGASASTTAAYDYILIDSRTGITEIGGLCIGPLADRLVVLTSLNDQNVEMTSRFLQDVGITALRSATGESWDEADVVSPGLPSPRLAPKPTLLVASPVPVGEMEFKRSRLDILHKMIGPTAARLSYHPHMALLETVFVRDYREEYLALEYNGLADQIMAAVNDHPIQLAAAAQYHLSHEQHGELASKVLLRLVSHLPELGEPLLRQVANLFKPQTEEEFMTADQIYRVLTRPTASDRWIGFDKWGRSLLEWSERTMDSSLKKARLDEALKCFASAIEEPAISVHQKATALLHQGVVRERKRDLEGAIAGYTAVIDMPDAPLEHKVKATVGRGLAKAHAGDLPGALADLNTVIAMPSSPPDQKAKAMFIRAVVKRDAGDVEAALADYTALIEMPNVPTERKAKGLADRGLERLKAHQYSDALADFTAIIEMNDIPREDHIKALLNRGIVHAETGNTEGALTDWTTVVAMPEIAADSKAEALFNRGAAWSRAGEPTKGIADYTAAVGLPNISPRQRATALVNRGVEKTKVDDAAGAVVDFTAVVELPDAGNENKAKAFLNRGAIKAGKEDWTGAIADWGAVAALPDVSAELKAQALFACALADNKINDHQTEIAHLNMIVEMANAPLEEKGKALFNRAIAKREIGDLNGAMADLTRLIEMTGVPPEVRAIALFNRGVEKQKANDQAGAIADFTEIIEMAGAPTEPKAKALLNRGVARDRANDLDGAIADFTNLIELADAPAEERGLAFVNRGGLRIKTGDVAGARTDISSGLTLPGTSVAVKATAQGALGWLSYLAGEYSKAVELSREALAIQPAIPWIQGNLGLALLQTGSTDQALQEYQAAAAAATRPEDVQTMIADLSQAQQMNPQLPEATAILTMLETYRGDLTD